MDVISRFESLVPIANPSGQEDALRAVVIDALSQAGYTQMSVDAAGNLLLRIAGDAARETILLSAHLDSVPPCEGITCVRDTHADGRPIIRSAGKTILGADDKAGVATMIRLAERLAQIPEESHAPVEMLFSTREEIGLEGLKEFDGRQLAARCGYALDGEGPIGSIFYAGLSQKNIRAAFTGRAAHAGISPEKGVSAIAMAAQFVAPLPIGRINHETTLSIGRIEGGKANNIVPDACWLTGETRSHSPEKLDEVVAMLQQSAQAVREAFPEGQVELAVMDRYQRFVIPFSDPVILKARAACHTIGVEPEMQRFSFGSDAHILNQYGVPSVVLGMGFHRTHSLGEFVLIDELQQVEDWVWHILTVA